MQVGGQRQVPFEPPRKEFRYPFYIRQGGPQCRSGWMSRVQTTLSRTVYSYIIHTFGREKQASSVILRYLISFAGSVRAGHGTANEVFPQITRDFRVVA
jgi:hypothetical protein